MKFNKKSKLHRHLFAVHQFQKPYPCPREGCRKAYFKKTELDYHLDTFHKKISVEIDESSQQLLVKLVKSEKKELPNNKGKDG